MNKSMSGCVNSIRKYGFPVAAVYDRRRSLTCCTALIFLRLRAIALALRGAPLQSPSSYEVNSS